MSSEFFTGGADEGYTASTNPGIMGEVNKLDRKTKFLQEVFDYSIGLTILTVIVMIIGYFYFVGSGKIRKEGEKNELSESAKSFFNKGSIIAVISGVIAVISYGMK